MRKAVGVTALLFILSAILAGCGEALSLPSQALAPTISRSIVNGETYLDLDIGPLPTGMKVQARGGYLKQREGANIGVYRLKLHDILKVQNIDRKSPFAVKLELVYSYKGRPVAEVPLSHQVHPFTFLTIEPLSLAVQLTSTTEDSVHLSGLVAPRAELRINGAKVRPNADSRYSYRFLLPNMGINEITISAERPGEVAINVPVRVKRLAKLETSELKSSIAQVTDGTAVDNAGVERPVLAAAMQDVVRRVFAAPTIPRRPEQDTGGGGVGFFRVRLEDKEAQLHVATPMPL